MGINNNYTSNELQEKCNGIISLINENEDMKLVDKHEVLNFFDSIRVTLIRHINGQEGMFNELYNVNNIELQNTIIEKNGGNEIYRELDSKKKSIHEKTYRKL